MGSYDEIMLQMSEMKSRFQSGFSSSDRLLLDSLHRLLFGKEITNTGCSDCYRDAYVIIYNHLKKSKTMPEKPNYVLKAGALIHPAGTSNFYVNPIPDEVAEEHLSKYPSEVNKFAHLPTDWEDRVAAYKARKLAQAKKEAEDAKNEVPATSAEDAEKIKALKAQLAEAQEAVKKSDALRKEAEDKVKTLEYDKSTLEQEIEGLKAALEGQTVTDGEGEESDVLAEVRMELATTKAELESANEEIASLKSDNRALKAANTRLKNNGAKDTE